MCLTGGMLGGPTTCVAEVATTASSGGVLVAAVIILMFLHNHLKGGKEWPIDVDVMEDEE